MKTILFALDGTYFSKSAFEFARQLNQLERIYLKGIFVPRVTYANLNDNGIGNAFVTLVEEDVAAVQNNIEDFRSLCLENNIWHGVHNNFFEFTVADLKRESRFADLFILDGEISYENSDFDERNAYLKEILQKSECPVLIVPEKCDFPKTNIVAYDGSESSVYAIKQFISLFPKLCDNKTLLIYSSDDTNSDVPNKTEIKAFASRHFISSTVIKLPFDPKKFFSTWIAKQEGAVLITGSYGRSTVSQLFKRSFVSDVIRDHRLPVFISHK